MKKYFVPAKFNVPIIYKTNDFTIRKLTVADAKEDYAAVMEAKDHIHEIYPKEYTGGWPEDTLTLLEDENDLKRHEEEFIKRISFAYTVFNYENKKCLGCLYIEPSAVKDAEVTMWTRDKETDKLLYKTVIKWIENEWPFEEVSYPILDELFEN